MFNFSKPYICATMILLLFGLSLCLTYALSYGRYGNWCSPSLTTASGTVAPESFCSGDLIFEDNFDSLDLKKWQHEITLAGGGSWEFQWYTNNRSNSIAENGILHIKPTLTADHLGEHALRSFTLDINAGNPGDSCTNPSFFGCLRTGTPTLVLNPIKSARIRTSNSFSFRYGRIEVRAKNPAGDWLFPAIWMYPRYNSYGNWPASGEIDIMESRGNRDFVLDDVNIGVQQIESTLHWGPDGSKNYYTKTRFPKNDPAGFDKSFHKYEMIWSPNDITFKVDDIETGNVTPPQGGFWELSELNGTTYDNPWKTRGKMAPFDQEFYIIMNLAVGGVGFFSDNATNPIAKPWLNTSPTAATDFWNKKDDWLSTWNLETNDSSHFQIDYVKVFAL